MTFFLGETELPSLFQQPRVYVELEVPITKPHTLQRALNLKRLLRRHSSGSRTVHDGLGFVVSWYKPVHHE